MLKKADVWLKEEAEAMLSLANESFDLWDAD